MFVALDVDYRDPGAIAAAVSVAALEDDVTGAAECVAALDEVAAYVPGDFAARELPCLLAVLALLKPPATAVLVDGHVWLGAGRPGLGARLAAALAPAWGEVAVVGVAKNPWHDTSASVAVERHGTRALWVSSCGVDVDTAARWVQAMHGPHRIPTLLRRVDRLCRDAPTPSAVSARGRDHSP